MKTNLLIFTALLTLGLSSCLKEKTTPCENDSNNIGILSDAYWYYPMEPVYLKAEAFRSALQIEKARKMQDPGRIYYYEDYLFVIEEGQGIHLIDNYNPHNPVNVGFIAIPGCSNMAILNNVLYADSYVDLVTLNVSSPARPEYLNRVEDVFLNNIYYDSDQDAYLVGYRPTVPEEELPCLGVSSRADLPVMPWFKAFAFNDVAVLESNAYADQSGGQTGIGGSMARYTIAMNHLYIVDNYSLNVFSLRIPDQPQLVNTVYVDWGIETIFPYGDKLFIGGNDGMHIMDISTPTQPAHLSTFQHATACDPVIVDGNLAYVTLRDGLECQTFSNQLDVVDVTELTNPKLLKSFPMYNPHGLSKMGDLLMICENDKGLKLFDAADYATIGDKLLSQVEGFMAFDVIALPHKQTALVIGKDGFYQFDVSDPLNVREVSRILAAGN
ncbi:MAG TPA: hypothetical protein PKA00_12440 [Saprospiraceae bacterium]|nr:hypothetical protein [Saprospiraceae bacterium]HMQ83716.1 hypothetical protein [Saprospiraceae bacterium]